MPSEEAKSFETMRKVEKFSEGTLKKHVEDAVKAKNELEQAMADYDKEAIDRLSTQKLIDLDNVLKTPLTSLTTTINSIKNRIAALEAEKAGLVSEVDKDAVLTGVLPTPEVADAPDAGKDDYFTKISVEVSSTHSSSSTSEHSTRTASQSQSSHGWWLWRTTTLTESVTETSSADAMSQMADAEVKVSFECMRVDIERPWMRPELFYDDDLRAAPGAL